MIIIANTPFEISTIVGDFPPDSVETQLLEQISGSAGSYHYDGTEQLKFELSLRREIVAAAEALSRSGLRFAVFHKSKCNPDYWERTANGGFQLKSGANPSEAIKDIFKNGRKYAIECATAMVIVYYGALLKVWPEETFNSLFPSIYLMNWHRLDPLLAEVGSPKRVDDILLGDRCYFRNPQVDPKVPELQGENVIVLPKGLYYGHGVGIVTADKIIRMLNANRIEGATESAYFMENSAARPNFKKLANAAQSTVERPVQLRWRPFPQPISG